MAHRCDACEVVTGRHHHKLKRKRKLMPSQSILTTVATANKTSNTPIEYLDLECSIITMPSTLPWCNKCQSRTLTITESESLARLRLFKSCSIRPRALATIVTSRSSPFWISSLGDSDNIAQMHMMSNSPTEPESATIVGKGAETRRTDNAETSFLPPDTDLRMDWGDACILGRLPNLNQYFLLIIDKGTEHFVSFATNPSASPLTLLRTCATFNGRKIRYLRLHSAKKFWSKEMMDYCTENDIVLSVMVAYNHKMQAWARVGGAIGCIKQHSRSSYCMLASPIVSGMTRTRISGSARYSSGHWQTPTTSFRYLTTAYVAGFLQHPQNCPCTLWMQNQRSIALWASADQKDHTVIVLLEARTSTVTLPHLAAGTLENECMCK